MILFSVLNTEQSAKTEQAQKPYSATRYLVAYRSGLAYNRCLAAGLDAFLLQSLPVAIEVCNTDRKGEKYEE